MARISGVDLQDNWRVIYALTRIKGIGWSLSKNIITDLKLGEAKRVKDLSRDEVAKLANILEKYSLEGQLITTVKTNVARLKSIGSYRGVRHARALPARGQRTRRNARTKRGKRKTVGAFKKEVLAKLDKGKDT